MVEGFRQGSKPGLFVTGTDTGVGKTLIACAIAAAIRRQVSGTPEGSGTPGVSRVPGTPGVTGVRLGVSKPFASGCRQEREGLVHEDAEALAHFADCRQPLNVINPIRFAAPLAPAVAAQQAGEPIDWATLGRSLALLDRESDAVLMEGVGGLMVPLDPARPRYTVLDFIVEVGYPVVVVVRAGLGTLNHTAMTARLLKQAGCRVAGLVINGYIVDPTGADDPSIASNRVWLEKLTGVKTLAVVPQVDPVGAQPGHGRIDPAVLEAVEMTYWPDVFGAARAVGGRKHIGR
jgi:dethiobiotin synthetase